MKGCPQCKLSYSDDTLEYYLEDGTKLIFIDENRTERLTVARQLLSDSLTEKNARLPFSNQAANLKNSDDDKP